MSGSTHTVAVLGAGSWGTALAIQLARAGRQVLLWGHDVRAMAAMARDRCNERYLPQATLPDAVEPVSDLETALGGADDLLVAVPSHALNSVFERVAACPRCPARLTWATKGLEQRTGRLPHQIAAAIFGHDTPVAVLSGPTFAREVGAGLPTAITAASTDAAYARHIAQIISSGNFRVYLSDDIVGVEVGGAVKNPLAIGAGISDGLGFGANTRIALINRGLLEMSRFGVALGAKRETFMGLAGMGDLVLTCTDDQSRNRRMGLALAAGQPMEAARRAIDQVVEGVYAARAVRDAASRHGLEMPITEQVYRVIYHDMNPADAVTALMRRPVRSESADWEELTRN